jgi:hypothetical protein
MKERKSKWIYLALVIGVIVVCAGVGLCIHTLTTPVPPTLPTPNGYDDFVQAGQQVSENFFNADEIGREDLNSLITANEPALKLFRSGLEKECRTPVEYSEAYMQDHSKDFVAIKQLARLIEAEGRLAELDENYGEASHIYCDLIKLGHKITQGGLLNDGLIGASCQHLGQKGLSRVLDKLSAEDCRWAMRVLDATLIGKDEILTNEKLWSEWAFRPRRLLLRMSSQDNINKAASNAVQSAIQNFTQKIEKVQSAMRQSSKDLNERIFELEQSAHGE